MSLRLADREAAEAPATTSRRTVLFVCLARGLGGSTRSLVTVLSGLGRDVTRVIAGPEGGSFPSLLAEQSLIEERVALWVPYRATAKRLSRPLSAARIARWCRRHRGSIAAIHANGPEELNLVVPAALASHVPIVVWSHARDVSPWMRRLAPMWRRLLRGHAVRWAAVSPLARRVLVESRLCREEDVAIVPNPIDPRDVRAPAREPSGPPVIGYLGSDATYKGFRMLPEVIDRLDDLPARWLLFSAERSRESAGAWERIRGMPEARVSVPGKLLDVRDAYARCDVVFVPSLDESFGRVAAEAMLNGLPVVASDLEPVRDLIGDDDAGLLFPPGDATAAAEALSRVLADPELRRRLGDRGRERASAFEPRSVVARLAELYGISPR